MIVPPSIYPPFLTLSFLLVRAGVSLEHKGDSKTKRKQPRRLQQGTAGRNQQSA